MPFKQQPESIQEIISRINVGQKDTTKKILDKWNSLVGRANARHCTPVDLRNGTLVINVESSAWMYALRLKKQQILKKLKELDKEVQDIQLRIGNTNKT